MQPKYGLINIKNNRKMKTITVKEMIELEKSISKRCVDFGKWIIRRYNDYGNKTEEELYDIFLKEYFNK